MLTLRPSHASAGLVADLTAPGSASSARLVPLLCRPEQPLRLTSPARPAGRWPIPAPAPREISAVSESVERQPKRLGRLIRSPALAIAAVLAIATAALAGRTAIVRAVPQAAAVYAALGLPVNLTGLAFSDTSSTLAERDGKRVLSIKAQIVNVAGKPRPVPLIEIVVRGPAGEALYTWSVTPPKPSLGPGERLDINARLASPPAKGERVDLQFAADRADRAVASLPR